MTEQNEDANESSLGDFSEFETLIEKSQKIDRKRGILTQTDREYLLGKKEIDGQDERNLKYRLRQRVQNALLDIPLLIKLSDEDLSKIADEIPYTRQIAKPYGLGQYILAFAFLYSRNDPNVENSINQFDDDLRNAILYAMREHGVAEDALFKDVSVQIEVEEVDTARFAELFLESVKSDTDSPQQLIETFAIRANEEDIIELGELLAGHDDELATTAVEYIYKVKDMYSESPLDFD